jgi:hypothetical protein
MFVYVVIYLGRNLTRATQTGSSHYDCTMATSATACCKISAVPEGQCSTQCVSLRDCQTAVGT